MVSVDSTESFVWISLQGQSYCGSVAEYQKDLEKYPAYCSTNGKVNLRTSKVRNGNGNGNENEMEMKRPK